MGEEGGGGFIKKGFNVFEGTKKQGRLTEEKILFFIKRGKIHHSLNRGGFLHGFQIDT